VDIIAPPNSSGLTITPSSGTVAVSDLPGSTVARDLGIASAAAASITGGDLDPRLTLQTPLSAFNNGAGATTANGLHITNGTQTKTVDISSASTVEDLFNLLKAEKLDLDLRINDAGNGLAISSRLSGAAFGIGENGGTDATSLGIRTLTGSTLLADLNSGLGVPVNEKDATGTLLPAIVEITRRDGSTTQVDLKGLTTVQDAIDAITAVDANLTASLNSVGNGISIVDTSGAGPLEVKAGHVADALGLTGVESGSVNTVPLAGKDVNQSRSDGVLSLLLQLETALRTGDNRALERLDSQFDTEIARLNSVRGELGTRLSLLETVENRLLDEDVSLQEQLSQEFDADLVDVVSRVANVQAVLQATLQISSSTLNLSLFSFL
jgi:flagellar hook-associated protein 3 FlgL